MTWDELLLYSAQAQDQFVAESAFLDQTPRPNVTQWAAQRLADIRLVDGAYVDLETARNSGPRGGAGSSTGPTEKRQKPG